jgi:leucyl aminopeptidase
MEIRVLPQSVTQVACDVLIVNLFAGVTAPGGATGAVDRALDGAISAAIAAGDFTGEFGQQLLLYTYGKLPARKVLVQGLGPQAKFDLPRARQASGMAARAAQKSGARVIASIAHGAGIGGLDPVAAAQEVVDGTVQGLWSFADFKTGKTDESRQVAEFLLVEHDAAKAEAMVAGARRGRIIAESANFTRQLQTLPGNKLTATDMAEAARAMAREVGLQCHVMDLAEIKRRGMNLLAAVNQGSKEPATCTVLRYDGGGDGPLLALVGKGVTFDTGGISIKGSDGMWNMVHDMSGGAAVLGAMRAIALLQPKARVIGVVPATDNMPDGAAYKPGDVFTGLSGKTVEIRSTDAEGRLILADALAYAVQEGAQRIVTCSTLTGALLVALGTQAMGLMSNDDAWSEQVRSTAMAVGEKAWPLPTWEDYGELLKSNVADMLNNGPRHAGAITAGIFLLRHVSGVPTVHLDIAGTAWSEKVTHMAPGATAVPMRTMIRLAEEL